MVNNKLFRIEHITFFCTINQKLWFRLTVVVHISLFSSKKSQSSIIPVLIEASWLI